MSHFEVANLIAFAVVAALGAAQFVQSRQIRKAIDRLTRAEATRAMLAQREVIGREAPLGAENLITRPELPPHVASSAADPTAAVSEDQRKTRQMPKPTEEALVAATTPSAPERGNATPNPTRVERITMVPPPAAPDPAAETSGKPPNPQARPNATDTGRPPPHPPPRKTLLGVTVFRASGGQPPAARDVMPGLPSVADPSDERPSSDEVTQVADRSVALMLEAAKAGELVRLDQEMRPVRPMNAPFPDMLEYEPCPACQGGGWEKKLNPATGMYDVPCRQCAGKRTIPRPPGTYGPGVH